MVDYFFLTRPRPLHSALFQAAFPLFKGHLFIHKNVHAEVRPFGCDTCGRRFSQKGNLLRHSLLHTNEKPFGCGVCRKFFVQKAHLVKHVVVHRQRLAALKRCRRREALEARVLR
ncbi:putative zinc finger protein Xfin-like [Penaeus vannamei]|uniref:Putative zinc finger protein Xfin-like n=1 Tax=Penaeus vannamei TaxID=6689 RepID=A0A423T3T4_PENVA|nr:putative zinc finger protein Xfin-like [Penaeus vannamei]